MPKIVDHDARREEIVDAAWRIIQRDGFQRATMREIAAEAGFAHGALKLYFPDKTALLTAVFRRAYRDTNGRVAQRARHDETGLVAVRTLCREILPLTGASQAEARVVVAFWGRALEASDLWVVQRDNSLAWRDELHGHLDAARADGELGTGMSDVEIVDALMSMNAGGQILTVITPFEGSADRQAAVLDAFLRAIASDHGRARLDGTPVVEPDLR